MALYVTDTHPLLWYTAGQHYKLSKTALRLFKEAEEDEGPLAHRAETYRLARRRR